MVKEQNKQYIDMKNIDMKRDLIQGAENIAKIIGEIAAGSSEDNFIIHHLQVGVLHEILEAKSNVGEDISGVIEQLEKIGQEVETQKGKTGKIPIGIDSLNSPDLVLAKIANARAITGDIDGAKREAQKNSASNNLYAGVFKSIAIEEARLGNFKEALAVVGNITIPLVRDDALIQIAIEEARLGNFKEALAVVLQISVPALRVKALSNIAVEKFKAEQNKEQCQAILEEAKSHLRMIYSDDRIDPLIAIAVAEAEIGLDSKRSFKQAREAVIENGIPDVCAQMLIYIAEREIAVGQDPTETLRMAKEQARKLRDSKDEIGKTIRLKDFAELLTNIAMLEVEAGQNPTETLRDVEEAVKEIRGPDDIKPKNENVFYMAVLKLGIAEVQNKAGEVQASKKIFQEAKEELYNIFEEWFSNDHGSEILMEDDIEVLMKIAELEYNLGQDPTETFERAKNIATRIRNILARISALMRIAELEYNLGQDPTETFELAKEMALQETDDMSRAYALANIAETQVRVWRLKSLSTDSDA